MSGMSTGQVVGGVVGTVVGYFVGYPMLGAQLGMLAGGAIDPGKGPNTSGPRLADLTVQTSTYGAVIPRLYGTQAFTGNVFWLEGNAIKETPVKKKTGGKGGKPKSTQTTWVNTVTFAVGLCKGPIAGIGQIWIKGELFYDAGSTDPSTVAASNAAAEGFEVYLGTNTQMPDPRIQADLGAANTPAWRGLAYIVFYDLNLAKYGETLMGAQVKVEVIKTGTSDTYFPEFHSTGMNKAFVATVYTGDTIVTVGLNYLAENAWYMTSTYGDTWTVGNLPGQCTYVPDLAAGNGKIVCVTNHYSIYVSDNNGYSWSTVSLLSLAESAVCCFGNGKFVIVTNGGYCFESTNGTAWTIHYLPRVGKYCGSVIWCEALGLYVSVYKDLALSKSFILTSSNSVTWTETEIPHSITWGKIGCKGNLLCLTSNGGEGVLLSTDAVTWTAYSNASTPTSVNGIASNSDVFLATKHGFYFVSSDAITWTMTNVVVDAVDCGEPVWIGSKFVFPSWVWTSVSVIPLRLTASNPTLNSVVSSEVLLSGIITAGDIHTSLLMSEVRGYLIGSQGSIRTSLEPLRASWPFDVVQHGYQLKFIPRGGSAVATIDADDLDAHNVSGKPGVQITTTREMDSQLPRVLTIKHSDYAREYEVGEQYAERLITDAINDETIDLPIVMTSAEAAGKAETLLYLRWLERFDIAFTIPATYNNLEPTDVVTLQTPEGDVSVRLTSINYTSDGRLECKGKYNSSAVYVPASVGSTPLVTGASTLPSPGPSSYVMLDVPYMHTAQADPSFLVSMWGADGWPGGVLMRTDDAGTTWNEVQAFTSPGGTSGIASNTIGSVDSRVWDKSSRLSVTLQAGDVFDATELAVLNGANHFAYGAHGRWEIIAVQKCTLVSGSSYTFSDMLRGRFGTEWAMTTHVAGDKVVSLTSSEVTTIGMSAATIGLERTYRGVTYDQDISTATDYAFTYNGVNLECLSPVYFTGYKAVGSTDWTLTWVRRSRTDGEWRDLVDAGLGETTEAYEVDIFSDGTYTTVKRTISATSPTCIYTTADQTTDFGSVQTTIYAKVYQMSSVVGRGYPTTATFTA